MMEGKGIFEIGDTVCCTYKKQNSSIKEQYRKGFISIDYQYKIFSRFTNGSWQTRKIKDFSFCKTTFSDMLGGGRKRFKQNQLTACKILLTEKINIFSYE